VFDLLILDWLMFCTWTPQFVVLPGTEGMAGYKDYGLHFRGFLIGLLIVAVISAIVTAIVALV
jgi:tetrahydromethanopterin S-methyltransferase subunit B